MDRQTTPSGTSPRTPQRDPVYPTFADLLPTGTLQAGHYEARFARSLGELDDALRLRFEVFNLELGEGLAESYVTGRDADAFDLHWHHLMVHDTRNDEIVGTYRMQTVEMADAHTGFYSEGEFDLTGMPEEMRCRSVELGRACIARDHRNRMVLFLLWKGLAAYAVSTGKRYLFGCSSITSQDPVDGLKAEQQLRDGGFYSHLQLPPLPELRCDRAPELGGVAPDAAALAQRPEIEIPRLFGTYLRYGSKICSPPAIDREFRCIDFLTVLDLEDLSPRARSRFFD